MMTMAEEPLSKAVLDTGIDDMTPAVWRTLSRRQRRAWFEHWQQRGHFCFTCVRCDFPVAFGGAPCEVCDEGWFARRREP